VAERPILFSGPLVRAILDGRKTETRRLMKPQPQRRGPVEAWSCSEVKGYIRMDEREILAAHCPIAHNGDTLWIRERWRPLWADHHGTSAKVRYAADGAERLIAPLDRPHVVSTAIRSKAGEARDWPSIHMPRWASRITLRVTEVCAERLQRINCDGARAEGVVSVIGSAFAEHVRNPDEHDVATFAGLWDSIYGKSEGSAWSDNPWVWVVKFEREESGR
jgi:hypothetical protein